MPDAGQPVGAGHCAGRPDGGGLQGEWIREEGVGAGRKRVGERAIDHEARQVLVQGAGPVQADHLVEDLLAGEGGEGGAQAVVEAPAFHDVRAGAVAGLVLRHEAVAVAFARGGGAVGKGQNGLFGKPQQARPAAAEIF